MHAATLGDNFRRNRLRLSNPRDSRSCHTVGFCVKAAVIRRRLCQAVAGIMLISNNRLTASKSFFIRYSSSLEIVGKHLLPCPVNRDNGSTRLFLGASSPGCAIRSLGQHNPVGGGVCDQGRIVTQGQGLFESARASSGCCNSTRATPGM